MHIHSASTASRTYPAAVSRDIVKEMADVMRTSPGCTYDDLRGAGFSARQIDQYQLAAKNLADRLSVRRVA